MKQQRRDLWIIAAAMSIAALALPVSTVAQPVRYGVVMDLPRTTLDTLWRDVPDQVERAYCITNWSVGVYHVSRTPPIQDDTVFRVFGVSEALTRTAGPNSVDFDCGDRVPELHVHTPSTCSGDNLRTCVVGGLNAYSCQPSRRDLEKLVQRGDPFAVIQCDRHVFRFYYPSDYSPTVTAAFAAGAGSSSKPDPNAVPLTAWSTRRPPR